MLGVNIDEKGGWGVITLSSFENHLAQGVDQNEKNFRQEMWLLKD